MQIKVCGMREAYNIKAVAALQPDYMGFICYGKSARYIGELEVVSIDVLSATVTTTGVFVNEDINTVMSFIEKYQFKAVQLHGDESPGYAEQLKGKVQVIKAFGVDEQFHFSQLKPYLGCVDYFLFDTKTSGYGGSGTAFDWAILEKYTFDIPFFLSGGISLENLPEVKQIQHPMLYGVDLNSRFEREPALKDVAKLQQAFNYLRN